METSLRDKAKDFGAVHRSYESIAKHNQVRGPSWRGTVSLILTRVCTRVHTPWAGMQLVLGVERCTHPGLLHP